MPTATELKPGDRIGEYLLEERIGQGGFGDVWRARHHVLSERRVAIKVPHDDGATKRLRREGVIQDKLDDPRIVRTLGLDPDHDPPYLVVELVEGETLRERLLREKKLAPKEAVRIAQDVLGALARAHAVGVVHRDVKPENILLQRESGAVKVADFGLGRLADDGETLAGSLVTKEGSFIGTLAYMAPEQKEPAGPGGRKVDERADIYAFGIVLFEMLCGTHPVGGEVPSDHVPELDRRVDAVFRRCYTRLEKRYKSAEQVLVDLKPVHDKLHPSMLARARERAAKLAPKRPDQGGDRHRPARPIDTTDLPIPVVAVRKPPEIADAQWRVPKDAKAPKPPRPRGTPPPLDAVPPPPPKRVVRVPEPRPPHEPATRPVTRPELPKVGVFPRAVATILDAGVFFVLLMAARLFAGPLLDGPVGFAIAGGIARVTGAELGLRQALLGTDALVVGLVWWTVLTGLLGATPGKALLGLRVRRADGRPLGLFRGLVRTIAYGVSAIPLGLGFLAILLHPRGRAFHDIIGGSVVVWRSTEAT